MDKEQWKDEIISSLQGLKRVEPNPFLFAKIEERLKSSASQLKVIIPLPKLSLAFAGVVVLFVLNFFVLKNSSKSENLNENSSQRAYSLNNVNYQLY